MQRRVVMLAVACILAAVDLAHRAITPTPYRHERPAFIVIVATLIVAGLVALVPRIPSRAALVGASVAVGGALGNVVAALLWARGVPDPFVLGHSGAGVAFNLADVYVFAGDIVLISGVLIYAMRNREALRTTV